ncbi:TPA: NERD domain-containing protein [Stenotrophomonas maltophilia]
MTIHAFAGEKASRTHENQMLQMFLERLEDRWSQSTDWIYVVANAMWEGAEVDLVCILPTMILVADFKNYRGRISGAENGPWFADGVPVKGGAQKNPYVQLRNNRYSIMDWLKARANLGGRNLGHLAAGVIFSGPIIDELDISQRSKSWFHVTDLDRCVTTLDCLASPELTLRQDEVEHIVRVLGVTPHRWRSSRPAVRPVGGRIEEVAKPPLTQHQLEALGAIGHFLQSDESRSMSVLGMTATGKTRLLSEVVEHVERLGRKAVALTPNARLRLMAEEEHGIEARSVYQHLYLDSDDAETDKTSPAADSKPNGRGKSAPTIPLRECKDPEDCVYLIDDAHLLGDALFRTADGKQYGSGHLLTDLFEFSGLAKGSRQAIFFGDPYQIQRAAPQESVLDGTFQALRGVAHVSLPLEHVIELGNGKALLGNALTLVEAMRAERFSYLDLAEDDSFRIVDARTAAQELQEHFRGDPFSVWHLADTNAKVAEFVRWLRPRLYKSSPLQVLEPGELIELSSACLPDGVKFTEARQVRPGYRYCVGDVGPSKNVEQTLKGRPDPIVFRVIETMTLEGAGVLVADHSGEVVRVLENYLTAEKPELPADMAIAVRVWAKPSPRLNTENSGATEQDGEDEGQDEAGLPGVTLIRYGYAATVHRAQGMSQPLCYVNGDHAAGRHSDAYFRWLYTSLTTAGRTLTLFNYKPIHPFDSIVWNARAAEQLTEIPVGAGWSFSPVSTISESEERRAPLGLAESKNLPTSIAIWLRIVSAADCAGWSVTKANCGPYAEKYELSGPDGDKASLAVKYDGKHVIKALHLDDQAHWPLLCGIAEACLGSNEYSPIARNLLAALGRLVSSGGWHVVSAAESDWRLNASVVRNPGERVWLEINFDKQGLVTTVRPLKFSQPAVLEEIRGVLQ